MDLDKTRPKISLRSKTPNSLDKFHIGASTLPSTHGDPLERARALAAAHESREVRIPIALKIPPAWPAIDWRQHGIHINFVPPCPSGRLLPLRSRIALHFSPAEHFIFLPGNSLLRRFVAPGNGGRKKKRILHVIWAFFSRGERYEPLRNWRIFEIGDFSLEFILLLRFKLERACHEIKN